MDVDGFSTGRLPRDHSVQRWRSAVRRMAQLNFNTTPQGLGPFQADMRVFPFGQLRLSTVRISAVSSSHEPTKGLRAGSGASYLLGYRREGSAFVAQDGREAIINCGDFVLLNTSRPFHLRTTSMCSATVEVALETMQGILPEAEGLTAICIPSQSGAGMILRNTLNDVFGHGEKVNDEASGFVAEAIPYMIAGALTGLPKAHQLVPGRTESYHRYRIRSFVRSNLKNLDLTPDLVARSVGISLRYVHQLFADEPTSLMEWIWTERLSRCADDLVNPTLRTKTISEIAHSWGFKSSAHFSRMFSNGFHVSPRAYRMSGARHDVALPLP